MRHPDIDARVDRPMRHLWLLLTMWALPVAASDFGARYPAGSIQDAEQAQAALKEADAEMARIGQSAKTRDAECLQGFFVNSCRDDVRREKELAEREVRRVRVEARDLQRRIDSEKVAKRRADKTAARAAEEAQRPQNEEKARAAAQARDAEVKRRDAPAPAVQAQSAEQSGRRPTQDRLTAAQRAENVRKFQQKQEQAQKRAQEMEVERKENEQRRAEKRKQLEQREAEREALRKKAAESIK